MKKQVNKPAVNTEQLTVEFWRGRFETAFGQFDGLTELAKVLGDTDEQFAGISGYRKLESVKRKQAGLILTATVVQLMEKLRPVEESLDDVLKRQKLVAPE